MDKYLKLQCVKGLLMSLEEQLGMRFQKDGLDPKVKNVIVDKYYDAILKQLELSSDEKKKELVISLHNRGMISENCKNELLNETCENTGDETPEYAFTIIINGRRHVVHTPKENQTIDWQKIVLLSELAKTGKEILIVTFTYNQEDNIKNSGTLLEVSESIEIKEDMIFNVCNTSKGEK